jgi:hypothetical protein
MGWSNSVPIFHEDVTFILQEEIPHITVPYIDDVPVKGPKSQYKDKNDNYETIPENSGIRQFVWEHFQNLNRIVQRMKYCGGTFSGHKAILCAQEIIVLGHRCTPEGRLPDEERLKTVAKWTRCANVSEVRSFLNTIGVARIFIRNFAKKAHHLNKLTCNNVPFEFGPDQKKAMEDLKQALFASPALKPINYESNSPVILAVDTSIYAIGSFLAQCDPQNPKRRYYNRFGSITLNERESRFSQPKLEIYGLYRTLRNLRIYLVGIRNLVVEVDARYIKGMLQNPDIAPNATINRWITLIMLFHFTLVHVPSSKHGPDGLSSRLPQDNDDVQNDKGDDFEDWVDQMHGFMHIINDCRPVYTPIRQISQFIQTTSQSFILDDDKIPEEIDLYDPTNELQDDEASKNSEESSNQHSASDSLTYSDIPRSRQAILKEQKLKCVIKWHEDFKTPPGYSHQEYDRFVRYSLNFFKDGPQLWRKDAQGAHKLVLDK